MAWAGGLPIQMTEGNSKSRGGIKGVSDTFGAALWTLDWALEMAAAGGLRLCMLFCTYALQALPRVRRLLLAACLLLPPQNTQKQTHIHRRTWLAAALAHRRQPRRQACSQLALLLSRG